MENLGDVCALCFEDATHSEIWQKDMDEFEDLLKQLGLVQNISQLCSCCVSNFETLKCVHKLSTISNKKILNMNKDKITEQDLRQLTNAPNNVDICEYVVCRLCLKPTNNVAFYLYDSGRNMFPIKIVMAMMDTLKVSLKLLDVTANPILCWICWQRVQISYSFLRQIEMVMDKVNHYQELVQKADLNRQDLIDIRYMWDQLGNTTISSDKSDTVSIPEVREVVDSPSYALDHDYLERITVSPTGWSNKTVSTMCMDEEMPCLDESTEEAIPSPVNVREELPKLDAMNKKNDEKEQKTLMSALQLHSKAEHLLEVRNRNENGKYRRKRTCVNNTIRKSQRFQNPVKISRPDMEVKKPLKEKNKKKQKCKLDLEKKFDSLMSALRLHSSKQEPPCIPDSEVKTNLRRSSRVTPTKYRTRKEHIPTLSSINSIKTRYSKNKKPKYTFETFDSDAPTLTPEIDSTPGSYPKDLLILQKEEIIKKVRPSKAKLIVPLISVIPKLKPPVQPKSPVSYEFEVLNFDNEVQTSRQIDPDEVEIKREMISEFENDQDGLIVLEDGCHSEETLVDEDGTCPNLNTFIKSEPLEYIEIEDDSFEVNEPPELELQGPCSYDPTFPTISDPYSVTERSSSPVENANKPEESSILETPTRVSSILKSPCKSKQVDSAKEKIQPSQETTVKKMPVLQDSTCNDLKHFQNLPKAVVKLIPFDLPLQQPLNKLGQHKKKNSSRKKPKKNLDIEDVPLSERLKWVINTSKPKKGKSETKQRKIEDVPVSDIKRSKTPINIQSVCIFTPKTSANGTVGPMPTLEPINHHQTEKKPSDSVFRCTCCPYPTFINKNTPDDYINDEIMLNIPKHGFQVSLKRAASLKRWYSGEHLQQCTRCDFKTKFLFKIGPHIRFHMLDAYLYKCSVCGYRTPSLKLLEKHGSTTDHAVLSGIHRCHYCKKWGLDLVKCASCNKNFHPPCVLSDQVRFRERGCFHFNVKANLRYDGLHIYKYDRRPLAHGPQNHCNFCKKYVINWINCTVCRKVFHHHCYFYSNLIRKTDCANRQMHQDFPGASAFFTRACIFCRQTRPEQINFCNCCKLFMHQKCFFFTRALNKAGCKHLKIQIMDESESTNQAETTELSASHSDNAPRCVYCLSDSPAMGPLVACPDCDVKKHLICDGKEVEVPATSCSHDKLNGNELIESILASLKVQMESGPKTTHTSTVQPLPCTSKEANEDFADFLMLI
ncbi:uncharacterized protein LOC126744411 isoform X2 [Anthonomus grandis grandis]|uniref:uncharacterized protein LOC126744411 isoform X2 n=1 Tax=Anthonomus grandis grandis TaxID=2921223 RepID=UPI0021657822|nr:uncharacterized protein LOC126744411 isoform X2 [Anthonomus grandis grandis]